MVAIGPSPESTRPVRWLAVPAMVLTALLTTTGPAHAGVRAADVTPPTAPGAISVVGYSATGFTLTWAPSTDDTKVASYSVAELAVLGGVRCGGGQTTSTTLGWLSPNRTYVFVVSAVDWFGNESPRSAQVTVTTPAEATTDTTAPSAPGTPTTTSITPYWAALTWAASTDDVGVTAYTVLDVSAGTDVAVATSTTTKVTVPSLTPGRTYVFVVVAQDAAGNVATRSGQLRLTMPAQNVPAFAVAYTLVSQWPGGFQAEVTIRDLDTVPINGWTLAWTFPNGQRITQLWGAGTPTTTGDSVSLPNAPWNATIPAGGSVSFGFTGTATTGNRPPTAFTLNGVSNT